MKKNVYIALMLCFFVYVPLHAESSEQTSFGHIRYEQVDTSGLVDVGQYRSTGRVVQMRKDAENSFLDMKKAALDEGVKMIPISGFRTLQYQKALFDKAVERGGSPLEAAKWVAPSGFSEHHTGLALDFGDEGQPLTDVETAFKTTDVFYWLDKNAKRFGFELSFPENNKQGVSYEPWHWKYVGEGKN